MSPRDTATTTKTALVIRELQSLMFNAPLETRHHLCLTLGFRTPGDLVQALSVVEAKLEHSLEYNQESLILEERGIEVSLQYHVKLASKP